jgi:membrane protein implicated in regulation of membrane protease activity
MKTITSGLFSLDFKDGAKGLLVAVGGAIIAAIQTSIQAGSLSFKWSYIGSVALAAGLAYLGKNFFTPAKEVAPANPIAK